MAPALPPVMSQADTTQWGKYEDWQRIAEESAQTKAFSAHGNAAQNQGGWDTNETWPNTRNSVTNVACYDCHNSHGSGVSGRTTSYESATTNAGIMKDTTAGKGGYTQTYKPTAGGSTDTKNAFTAGAALCFDCHQTAISGTKPWGYGDTFGATQKILGYWDTDFFGLGTFGSQTRYPYKAFNVNQGGHFGASATLSGTPSHAIGGLCTPCHDPHGISPTLGADKQYAVPLLKGTWVTSPYKEDVAPANNAAGTVLSESTYHIDQNTVGANFVTQTDVQFAGLCLKCHAKSNLTNGSNHTWKSKDRIHEAVKGWKTANGTIQHNYTCSKCHAPHNSNLPRLMVTNCLNSMHKSRVGFNPSPVVSGSGSGGYYGCDNPVGAACGGGSGGGGSGSGSFPGNFSSPSLGANGLSCHEGNSPDESWNDVTPWANVQPSSPSGISATAGNGQVTISWTAGAASTTSLIRYGTTSGIYTTTIDRAASPKVISGLTNGTPIFYQVAAKNTAGTTWNTTEYSATPVALVPSITLPTATAVSSTTATLGANVTSNGGLPLTANGTCWGTTPSPITNCVDQGSHATGVFTQSRTGLTEGSLFYSRGYATNSLGTSYTSDLPIYTEPTQPNTLTFPSVGAAGITVNWVTGSSGTARNVIVVMKAGSAVNADPVDGTTYNNSAAFGSGTQIGTGNYVVYKGTGTSIAVTGLSANTTYYVKVYAFAAGAAGTENYNITSPLAGTTATSSPTAPTLTTPTAVLIGSTTATLGANVTTNGGMPLTANGTCWGTTPSPTTNCVDQGSHATGVFNQNRTGLPEGSLIYYRGYATNSVGTSYTSDLTIYTEPIQPSTPTFANVGATSLTVNWTTGSSGSARNVIVFMRYGGLYNASPVDGTTYTANASFGGSTTVIWPGYYPVYKGTGNSVTVTNLTANSLYNVKVYAFAAGASGTENYNTTSSPNANVTTTTSVSAPTLTSPTATAIGNTTATLGANVTSNGGAALTANGTCWGTTANPTTNCLDQGSHAVGVFTQSRTGLPEGSLVYYRGYATNSAGTSYSSGGTIYMEPIQPNTLSFTSVGGAGVTVNWATGSTGNAKNVIVVMKSGSAVNADPVDGTTYTANAAFGSGTQIGTANYVVYKGTGTSVPVTGLSPSTTYYVKVYAFRRCRWNRELQYHSPAYRQPGHQLDNVLRP